MNMRQSRLPYPFIQRVLQQQADGTLDSMHITGTTSVRPAVTDYTPAQVVHLDGVHILTFAPSAHWGPSIKTRPHGQSQIDPQPPRLTDCAS